MTGTDAIDEHSAREQLSSTPTRVRMLGTPNVWLDFALAAIMLAFGVVAIAVTGGTLAGWVIFGIQALVAAYFVAIGLWSRRHHDEIARYWRARRALARASMRRHPLRWLIGLPIAAGLDAALRWNRHGHHSAASTAIVGAIDAVVGLVVVGIAVRRAQRERSA